VKGADDWEPVEVRVRHGASIGALTTCVGPVIIGRRALVAAGAVVTKDVLDFALGAGVPAKQMGWVGPSGHPLERGPDGVCTYPVTAELSSSRRTSAACVAFRSRTASLLQSRRNHDHQRRHPPARPLIGEEERAAVVRVMRSGMLAQGPEVAAFEHEFADHFKLGRGCVAGNSGTSGLHLGLLAAGVKAGDEVIVPSFTFAATERPKTDLPVHRATRSGPRDVRSLGRR
jgi:hypothetical protein